MAFKNLSIHFEMGLKPSRKLLQLEPKMIYTAMKERKLEFLAEDVTNAKKLNTDTQNTFDAVDEYFHGMGSLIGEIIGDSEDEMDARPAQRDMLVCANAPLDPTHLGRLHFTHFPQGRGGLLLMLSWADWTICTNTSE